MTEPLKLQETVDELTLFTTTDMRTFNSFNELAGISTHNTFFTPTPPVPTWITVQQQSADWQNKITALRAAGDEMNAAAAETELAAIISGTLSNLQQATQRTMAAITQISVGQQGVAETSFDSGNTGEIEEDEDAFEE